MCVSENNEFYGGIDIGSPPVELVILDQDGTMLFRDTAATMPTPSRP